MKEDGQDENRAGRFIVERSRYRTFCNFTRWRVILASKMTLVDETGRKLFTR